MASKCFKLVGLALFLFNITVVNVFAEGAKEEELADLKTQVRELLKRIEKLEAEQFNSKEESKKAGEELKKVKEGQTGSAASKVDLANSLSKLKIKGRAALGFFDSGKAGSYPAGSFEMPDAKLQFAFQADAINAIVLRFNLNNATSQSPLLDFFYLQSKNFIPALKDSPFSLETRLGRFKLGFGEETWSDNSIEGVLPSNSVGKVGGIDEGIETAGKIKLDKLNLQPLGWVLSVSNGNSGVGSDSSAGKAFMGKLYHSPIKPLYLSASYYDSGDLGTQNAEMSIAGLISRPTGTNNWQRKVWETDARYDFGKGDKPMTVPLFSDSRAVMSLAYGGFHDLAASERSGNFGFLEGIYNLNKKFYAAARFSFVDLSGDTTASLNSVTANRYERYSLGGGYRCSDNIILKLSYDWNKQSGSHTEDADDNLLSALVSAQF